MVKEQRYVIYPTDKRMIIDMYNSGWGIKEIATELKFSIDSVKSIIKYETGHYTEVHPKFLKRKEKPLTKAYRAPKEEIEESVVKLYNSGKNIEQIIDSRRDVTRSEITDILERNGLIEVKKPEVQKCDAITQDQIEKVKSELAIGDIYVVNLSPYSILNINTTVTIQGLYKNFVKTDKGCVYYPSFVNGTKVK